MPMEQQSRINTADEILTTRLPAGAVALWWLGQAGFALRSDTLTIYLDPFFSKGHDRLVAPPMTPEASPPADFVLCTHEHIDHLDLPLFAKVSEPGIEKRIDALLKQNLFNP